MFIFHLFSSIWSPEVLDKAGDDVLFNISENSNYPNDWMFSQIEMDLQNPGSLLAILNSKNSTNIVRISTDGSMELVLSGSPSSAIKGG